MPTEVKGALALRKALRNFTPDLARALPKAVGDALKPITRTARGYLPDNGQVLSGWLKRENSTSKFPAYNVSLAKSGISYKSTPSRPNRQGFRSLVSLSSKNAAAAIYERMGKLSPESQFVKNQMSKYNNPMKGTGRMQGRALLRAYDENNGKAKAAVIKAIEGAAARLNQRARV